MSHMASSSDRTTRRCLRACSRCRDMKVRCSGTFPCSRCQRKREPCFFRPEEARVTVSHSYLQSLESRARNGQQCAVQPLPSSRLGAPQASAITPPRSTIRSVRSSDRNVQNGSPSDSNGASCDALDSVLFRPIEPQNTYRPNQPPESSPKDFSRNPLVDAGESFAQDPNGKYWYMGPSSSWAFCRRVLALIGSRTPEADLSPDPWYLDTFNLSWSPLGLNEQPNVENLPTHDYVVFLVNAVKYHLGSFSEIINHNTFLERLERFYENPAAEANRSRFWYAQYLLVLAFGEAFTLMVSPTSLPGTEYASRALSLISTIVTIDRNSLVAIETFCLAALYLQSLDLRLMAFQMIGQALRLCIIEGFHRHMPPEQVGVQHSQRCNTIFWTAYVLDREFSALIGAPSSIRDEDITTKPPSDIDGGMRASAMALQIRLSRLTAAILTGVYGVDRNFDGTLIKNTQSVLQSVASISRDLGSFLDNKFQGTDIRTSKIATRLILSYHHCVVLTTRPLVMCVLQRRLAQNNPERSIPDGPISSLLQSCVYSALNILRALKTLGDSNLLESFLSCQLEAVFSSAFLLYIIDAVSPDLVPDRSWLVTAHKIIDMMIAKGSPAAQLRKRELQHLEQIMISFLRTEPQDCSPSSIPAEQTSSTGNLVPVDQERAGGTVDAESLSDLSTWGFLGSHGGFAMSPTEILSLAEGLDVEEFVVRD